MQPGTIIALAEDRATELRCEADRQRRAAAAGPHHRIRLVALFRRRPHR
jgi:hypothetical protein